LQDSIFSWPRAQATDVLDPPAILNWEEITVVFQVARWGYRWRSAPIVHYDRSVERWTDTCGPLTRLNAKASISSVTQQEESCSPVNVRWRLNAWCELAKSLKSKGGFIDTQTEARLV